MISAVSSTSLSLFRRGDQYSFQTVRGLSSHLAGCFERITNVESVQCWTLLPPYSNVSRPQVESHPQVGKRKLGERSKDKVESSNVECNNFLDLSPQSITPLALNLLRT